MPLKKARSALLPKHGVYYAIIAGGAARATFRSKARENWKSFASTKFLRNKLLNDLAGDIGEAEIAALETIGQPRVVQTKKVQHRGVEVVDVDWVFDDVPADFV